MRPGDLVGDIFEIERATGEGGMGTVYLARERHTGSHVALKILRAAGAQDRSRFEREARLLADLRHPAIVRYVAHGLTPTGESYLAMEWLEGEDLNERLGREGLSIHETLTLAQRIADALASAHARGIVHRDIKPSNLFLPGGDVTRVKLLDFGLARIGFETRIVTRSGVFMGTPGYVAPEQARGTREIDARADVFSLGCVLFECITGRPAFAGDHVMALLAKILLENAPRLSDLRDDVPPELDDLVARMLDKEPAARPADGAAVAAELSGVHVSPAARRASPSNRAHSLTTGEQRLVSVIMVSSLAGLAGVSDPSGARTVTPDELSAPLASLRAAAQPFGARVEGLADGSAVAVMAGKGTATDQATQAARCALAMHAVLPEIPMVLSTGRGVLSGALPFGDVIDRAARLLHARELATAREIGANRSGGKPGGPPRSTPVRLDNVTAGLLAQRFDVSGDTTGLDLLGERESGEAARTLLGKPTPCVGRERELAALKGFFDECVAEPMARAVLITGPAGIGKSRIRYEFLRAVAERAGSMLAAVSWGADAPPPSLPPPPSQTEFPPRSSASDSLPPTLDPSALQSALAAPAPPSIQAGAFPPPPVFDTALLDLPGSTIMPPSFDTGALGFPSSVLTPSVFDAGSLGLPSSIPAPIDRRPSLAPPLSAPTVPTRERRTSSPPGSPGVSAVEIWMARGDTMRAGSPFGMVAEMLRRAAGLLEGEPIESRRQKLRARVACSVRGPGDAARVTDFLGEMIGTPFPDDVDVQLRAARREPMLMNDQIHRAWEDFVTAECEAHPLLIVLEDLHWGDLPSVKLIDAALRSLREKPLMVLALARPDVHEIFPRVWSERGVQEIRLGELSRKASERLVRQVLGDAVEPEKVERVVAQAAGNAFYLEELIRAVAEGKGESLPETVLAMVQARLEALEPEARRVMRAGSIYGQIFWSGGVRALLGGSLPATQIDEWLDVLCDRELLVRRGASKFSGQEELTFRHSLVREGAYGMLTENDRVLGHRLAGEWLERAGEQDAMALGEHFERGNTRERAAAFYLRAAEQALEANDLAAVIARADRAVLCGAEGGLLGSARKLQAEAYYWQGRFSETVRRGLEAMRLLPRDDPGWFSAAADVAAAAWCRSDQGCLVAVAKELSRSPSEQSIAVAPQLAVTARVATQLVRAGLHQMAEPLFERLAVAPSEAPRDPAAAARLHETMAWRMLIAGDPAAACAAFQASAVSFERAGDVRNGLTMHVSAAVTFIQLGAYGNAEADLRMDLIIAQRMRLRSVTAKVKQNLGLTLAHRGALVEALEMAEAAVAAFVAQGTRWHEGGARLYLARARFFAGQLEAAEEEASRAAEVCATAPPLCCYALAVLAQVRLAQGRAREALLAAEEAIAMLLRLDGIEEGEALVRLMYAESLAACEERGRSRGALSSAVARLQSRAEKIGDAALRQSFLHEVPENARTLELGKAWLASAPDLRSGKHD